MPVLGTTVFPCYAPADRGTAAAIATFLEVSSDARVFLDEGEIGPDQDLLSKVREAHIADVILVLFSRHCTLAPNSRAQWEQALVEEPADLDIRIGFVHCDDSAPPRTLLPRFDCRGLTPDGLRQVKRWVRRRSATAAFAAAREFTGPASEIDDLGSAIADRPGSQSTNSAAAAYAFVRAYAKDFDEIVRVECAARTPVAVAGDLSRQLGLRLDGDLPANLERLRAFCAARRFMILLEQPGSLDVGQFSFGGYCSTLVVAESGPPEPQAAESLRTIQRQFADPRIEWQERCRLARIGRRVAREQSCIAELYELMEEWYRLAEVHGDRRSQEESACEIVWILEGWDRTEEAARWNAHCAARLPEQMGLPFGEGGEARLF